MTRRSAKLWWVAAILFALVNLAGEVWAAVHFELAHACIHGLLLLFGIYLVWRLAPRRTAAY